MQGHVRRRGKGSCEYIVDVGMAPAQRCQAAAGRFWVERRPKGACPSCGGKLLRDRGAPARDQGRLPDEQGGPGGHGQGARGRRGAQLRCRRPRSPCASTCRRSGCRRSRPRSAPPPTAPTCSTSTATSCPTSAPCGWRSSAGRRSTRLYAKLAQSGKRDGKRGLSALSIRHVHAVLHRALKDAVRWGGSPQPHRGRRPAPVNGSAREMKTWSAEQLAAFLAATREERLHALWHLLALTGMREARPWP